MLSRPLPDLTRQGLRSWRSKHQKQFLWSNKQNMVAHTRARSLLLSILQFRSFLLIPRTRSNSNPLPLFFPTHTGLLPVKCGNFFQQDDPLSLFLHLYLHLPHPLQDSSVEHLLISLTLLQETCHLYNDQSSP